MTDVERRQALEAIAAEVRSCTDCRLHEGRTRAVPGEGDPDTEVVFVGEGPGFNEDRLGRPFVGRAGDLLVKLLASIGWRREEVFITNVVKCRPPDNRDPQPDEIAACSKYLHRQLEILDPAVVVTLGRHSMARFMPGARISQAHGTVRAADPSTGARSATVFAMYHPAAALRTPSIERESFADMAGVPAALIDARRRRDAAAPTATPAPGTEIPAALPGPTQPMAAADLAVPSFEPGVAIEPPTVPAEPPALEPSVIEPRPAAPQAPPAPAATEDATPQLTLF